jgi:hypothetical protein
VREISILGGIKGEFKKKAYKEKYLAGFGRKKINGQESTHPLFLR